MRRKRMRMLAATAVMAGAWIAAGGLAEGGRAGAARESAGARRQDAGAAASAAAGVAYSVEAAQDVFLNTEPANAFWAGAQPIVADVDANGNAVPGYSTTIYSRWTKNNLYFLFVCPYEELNLKPDPVTTAETNQLWKWDVAEVFIGWNFENINLYKEFEISPQGEWLDLDINHTNPLPEGGWHWNSGFQVAARIDAAQKVWYGAMKIPLAAITNGHSGEGTKFRANFYRSQGRAENHKVVMWQAVGAKSFHTPERFGILELVATKP